MSRTIAEAAAEASTCVKCRLSAGRTQVVYGNGAPHADLMFIGEGPGFHEDKQGEPFVGAAGQLLNKLLHLIGIEREDVYVGNVVKCRPPKNRDPLADEIAACTPYLSEQIELVDPKVIVTLGNFSTRFVLDMQVAISKVRGQRFPWQGRTVIPTFHPAAILHSGGEKSRQFQELRSDFELVKKVLGEQRAEVHEGPVIFTSVGAASAPPPVTGPLVSPALPEPPAAAASSAPPPAPAPSGPPAPDENQMGLF